MTRRTLLSWLIALSGAVGIPVQAHGVKAGALHIDHPYALPTRPGMGTASVYFRGLSNDGQGADRLLSARTPVAGRVEIHQMQMQGDVMQMRALPQLELPPGQALPWRHGSPSGYHLMLIDLKGPLKEGDRFPVSLTFEKAGVIEVQVWVQTPRDAGQEPGHSH